MTEEELRRYAMIKLDEALWCVKAQSTIKLSTEDVLEIWGLTQEQNANTDDVSERK